MDRLSRHDRIIETEYYLYGGVVDVPKIYDADGKNHGERFLKGSSTSRASQGSAGAREGKALTIEEEEWLRRLIVDA